MSTILQKKFPGGGRDGGSARRRIDARRTRRARAEFFATKKNRAISRDCARFTRVRMRSSRIRVAMADGPSRVENGVAISRRAAAKIRRGAGRFGESARIFFGSGVGDESADASIRAPK